MKDDSEISRQARWQRKHRALGLCILCSEPAHKGMRCEKHYKQHRISTRLRYVPKVRGRYVTKNDRIEAEAVQTGRADRAAEGAVTGNASGKTKTRSTASAKQKARAGTAANPRSTKTAPSRKSGDGTKGPGASRAGNTGKRKARNTGRRSGK